MTADPLPPVVVAVPARDEARSLPMLLAALAEQVPAGGFALALLLDGGTDGSAALARDLAGALPYRLHLTIGPGGPPSAGRARREAMAAALRLTRDDPDALLLSTDADSRPAPDWIAAMRHALDRADVVAGRIRRDGGAEEPVQERIEAYYDRLHALRRAFDPVPWEAAATHHFTGAANLGFRAAAYRRLGGFAAVVSGEDALIVDEAQRAGLRVRRDAQALVHTSSRREGRAPGGLSAMLHAGAEPHVAHPLEASWQYRAQARARRAFTRIGEEAVRRRLGRELGLTSDHVLGVARDCPNGEAFAMRVVPAAPGAGALVPLGEAEPALARLERGPCGEAA